jgi:NADH-quinone oxidoreductase subunit G
VEVEGPGKMPRRLAISCRTVCEEGMQVYTTSEPAESARRLVLEFLLKNHPLDCPICDKAGECTLQNFAFDTGQGRSRSREERRALRKRVDFGDVILFDEERCILCTRCVRFQELVVKDPQLGVTNRGPGNVIGTLPGVEGAGADGAPGATSTGDTPLHGNYQGVLADVCPVGALTLKKFRFQARAWQLTATPSVCAFCSRGCNTHVETFRGEVKRIRPRFNADVNQYWMCDAGRFAYDDANDREGRLSMPLLKKDGEWREAGYPAALTEAGKLLKSAAGEALLAVASPYMTNEEGRAFLDLTKSLGATARFVAPPAGPADELLYTGDPCPNRKGLTDLGLAPATAEEVNELAKGAKACLLAGEFAVELLRLTPGGDAFLANGKLPVLTLERRALDAPAAAICFPAYNVYEKSGTFTNRQGLTQSLRPAIAPPPGARSDLETLEKLKEAVLASGHAAAKGAH